MRSFYEYSRRGIFGAILALAALSISAQQGWASDFYDGKTITVIVGNSAGSGGDVSARFTMAEVQKRIPGKPHIIVRNIAGAGGSIALNHSYEKAQPDGLNFHYGNWDPMGALSGAKGIRYVPEKFGVIGSSANERGSIVRTDIGGGLKRREDIVKAKGLRVGGRSSKNTHDLIGNLALTILGVDFRYIPGFRGMSKMAPGIQSGELQVGHTATGGFSRFFSASTKAGETMMLYYHPFFDRAGNEVKPSKIPFHDGVPSLSELYKSIHGKAPSGTQWEAYKWLRFNVHATSPAVIAPPGTPEKYLKIMRTALYGVWADKAFQKKWLAQFGDRPHITSTADTIRAFQS
jgi:hypothetical protein